ncbi:NYN domain-containing protein [Haloglycomyces albus]|uniref:NYN domain-containing protein n=1 Tax=Haloglycomyces albus TaxID=526067 RepID=UPI00046D269F|nr:NYN domain-containing protein [Haloglycomyces albus]
MNSEAGEAPAEDSTIPVFLPDMARKRIVDLTSSALPGLGMANTPKALRKFLKFNQAKRAKLGQAALIRELETNPQFRRDVAGIVSESGDELVQRFLEHNPPPLTEPALAAALAYLLQPEHWRDTVRAAVAAMEADRRPEPPQPPQPPAPPRAEEDKLRQAEKENAKLKQALADQRQAAADLHRELRALRQSVYDLNGTHDKLRSDLAAEKGRLKQAKKERKNERRRMESEIEDLRAELEVLRQHERESKQLHSSRLWLLLETLSGTASGIRRELGIDPTDMRPADYIAYDRCAEPETLQADRARALEPDDPAHLDSLLSLPYPHLIVDGYNVTLTAWKDSLTLEEQRERLVRGLGVLAAQSNAEVTVVFDGSDPVFGTAPAARGVRVLFSAKGEIADDVIIDMARVEPRGRSVIVVSNDQEVQLRSKRQGAYAVPAMTLVRRINRYRG